FGDGQRGAESIALLGLVEPFSGQHGRLRYRDRGVRDRGSAARIRAATLCPALDRAEPHRSRSRSSWTYCWPTDSKRASCRTRRRRAGGPSEARVGEIDDLRGTWSSRAWSGLQGRKSALAL